MSDSSLEYDRAVKLAAYARAGIPEYWIINLIDEAVEIYREPQGQRFEHATTVHRGSSLHPAGFLDDAIDASELLP